MFTLVDKDASVQKKIEAGVFLLPVGKIGKLADKLMDADKFGDVGQVGKVRERDVGDVKGGDGGNGGNKGTGKAVTLSEKSLDHANIGDFTINLKTGKISKMSGGGHGQDNIDFLKPNGIEYNIERVYPNGGMVKHGFLKIGLRKI